MSRIATDNEMCIMSRCIGLVFTDDEMRMIFARHYFDQQTIKELTMTNNALRDERPAVKK